MGMPHGKILVHTISDINDPTTKAPFAGPNGELGRLALESDLNTIELQVVENTTNISNISGGSFVHFSSDTAATSATISIIDAIPLSDGYNGASWTTVIESNDELNMRTSNLLAVWKDDGSTIRFNEVSTLDIGDTSDVSVSVTLIGGNINLQAIITGANIWNIKAVRISI